jgi:hypothetical protein
MSAFPPPEPEPLVPLEEVGVDGLSAPSPFINYFRPPQLGIIHFLAWITISALFFGLFKSVDQFAAEVLGNTYQTYRQSNQYAVQGLNLVILAAECVGMAVVLRGRFRHAHGRRQPGHFLIVVHSIFNLITSTVSTLGMIFLFLNLPNAGQQLQLFYAIWCISIAVLFWIKAGFLVWCWKRSLESIRWKVLFCVEALSMAGVGVFCVVPLLWMTSIMESASAMMNLYRIMQYFHFSWPLILVGTYIIVAILDYRKGPHRDWVHWLAIVTTILPLLIAEGTMLLNVIKR